MHAVIAAQGWTDADSGILAPATVAQAVRDAWEAAAPQVALSVVAVPDGGPGSALALAGEAESVDGVEARRVAGALVLAPAGTMRWSPSALGDALAELAEAGETGTVVVPVGDVEPDGDPMALVSSLATAREALSALDIMVLVGSDRPLLGFTGMAAAVREGREHDSALALAAQAEEERWAALAREIDPVATPRALLGPARLSESAGAGAARGLAYCLAALGARLVPAAGAMAALSGLEAAAADADLLVAAVPTLDTVSLDRGTVAAASRLAAARGVPCIAVTSHVAVGKRDLMAGGVAGAHEGSPGEAGLADQIRRVAQTWTPHR